MARKQYSRYTRLFSLEIRHISGLDFQVIIDNVPHSYTAFNAHHLIPKVMYATQKALHRVFGYQAGPAAPETVEEPDDMR